MRVMAGNDRIASSDADQIADAIGSRVAMRERIAEAPRLEEVAQRVTLGIGRLEERRRFPIEAQNLPQQGQVRRPDQVPALREEPVGAAAAVLEPAVAARHRERHVRVASRHAQLREQPHQVRIGAVVVDEEAGVERHASLRRGDDHGIGVATQPVLFLEQLHPMAAAQQVGGGQPGNARADDRDALHAPQGWQYRGIVVNHLSMTND